MQAISSLLSPQSIAVVGASADPSKTAGKPIHFLRKHGFKGEIYPVNPRVETIDGLTCLPDIEALPKRAGRGSGAARRRAGARGRRVPVEDRHEGCDRACKRLWRDRRRGRAASRPN